MGTPNVFLFTVDSLRYDYFRDYQKEIADLTKGTEFTDAVSTAAQTSSSMPTLATGKYTDETESWGIPATGSPQPLSEILEEYHYSTGLWTDNYLFGEEYNYDRGFQGGDMGKPSTKKKISNKIQGGLLEPAFPLAEWLYFNIYKKSSQLFGKDENFYRSARELNSQAEAWISEQDRPMFTWIHYMDTHHPYEPPSEYLDKYNFNKNWERGELSQFTREAIKSNGEGCTKEEIDDVKTAYKSACEYTGDELLLLVQKLIDKGKYDPEQDILIISSDHGECLSPEKYSMMGHVPPALWEEVIRVPLMVSIPDWPSRTISEQVSLSELSEIIISTVEAKIQDSPESMPSPSDLVTDVAHFVTEWSAPGQEIRPYRGVRHTNGRKIFGAHSENEDKIFFVRYNNMTDNVIFEYKEDSYPPAEGIPEDWSRLANSVRRDGSLLGSTKQKESIINKEHLEDLGYL